MADVSSKMADVTEVPPPTGRKFSDTIPMESVQRLAKLPVVESSLSMATDVYSRVKEANSVLNWTLSHAESTMSRAVEHALPVALPVAERLEKPLKRMDTLLCSSLDYVEAKVPAVKLPTQQLLETTSSYVESKLQPALDKAAELKQFGTDKMTAVKNFARESSGGSQLLHLLSLLIPTWILRFVQMDSAKQSTKMEADLCSTPVGTPSTSRPGVKPECPAPPHPTPANSTHQDLRTAARNISERLRVLLSPRGLCTVLELAAESITSPKTSRLHRRLNESTNSDVNTPTSSPQQPTRSILTGTPKTTGKTAARSTGGTVNTRDCLALPRSMRSVVCEQESLETLTSFETARSTSDMSLCTTETSTEFKEEEVFVSANATIIERSL